MKKEKNTYLHLNLLILMMLSFILRMGFPQLKFLFIPLLLYFFVHVSYEMFMHRKIPDIKHFMFSISLYLVLLLVYFLSMIYRTDFFLPVKEFISGILLLPLFYFFHFYLVSRGVSFGYYKKMFIRQIIIISGIVAFVGLVKLIYSVSGEFFLLSPPSQNALTSSVTLDYNFFALTVIFGFLSVLYQLYIKERIDRSEIIGYNLLMVLFSLVILTTQSRRSFVVFLVIFVLILLGSFFSRFYSGDKLRTFFKRNTLYLGLIAWIGFMGYFFVFFTSDQLKREIIANHGIYRSDIRIALTNAVNRYATVLGFGFQQTDLYEILWNQDENSRGFRKSVQHRMDRIFLDSARNQINDNSQSFMVCSSEETLSSCGSAKSAYLKDEDTGSKLKPSSENKLNFRSSLSSNLRSLFPQDVNLNSEKKNQLTDTVCFAKDIGRMGRWKYALQYFSGYSFSGKLLGNGFSYLSRFGAKFHGSSAKYGYPHNPIISALLYSGILGAAIYVFFLIYTVVLYIRHFYALQYFFLLFLLTSSYIFISGNSHFSVPAFAFLSLFPWCYHGLKTD